MAEKTTIGWTRSTRNFWAGCTKVGPGCDGCYAEAFQRWIQGKDPETGEAKNWGPGRPRIPYLDGAVKDLGRLQDKALREAEAGIEWRGRRGFWPVFINSHSDIFDNEVPQEWRDIAFKCFEDYNALTFFLVTKRIGNAAEMVPARWMEQGFPPNVRLLITVVNQAEADRDVPKLLALPCRNGISCEPQIEEINWVGGDYGPNWLEGWTVKPVCCNRPVDDHGIVCCGQPDPEQVETRRIEWIIVGGESDQPSHVTRPFVLGWAKVTVRQCKAAGVPVFVKQLGSKPTNREGDPHPQKHPKGEDPAEWPLELQVQEFPA